MLRIDGWTCLFAALLILVLPLDWLLAAFCAAIFHETCHIAAIRILGGRVRQLRIGISGAVIETEIFGKGRELIGAAAGPLGSLLLVSLCHIFPKLAICGWLQGLFNLLPLYPLDGGRILQCLLSYLCPFGAEKVMKWAEIITYALFAILMAAGILSGSLGILGILAAILLIIRAVLRKRPCKRSQIGVQ